MNTKETQAVEESYEDAHINYHQQDFKDKYEIFGDALDYKTAIGSWNINSGGKVSSIKDSLARSFFPIFQLRICRGLQRSKKMRWQVYWNLRLES